MTVRMDERVAAGIRDALVEHVRNEPVNRRRVRVRRVAGAGAAVVLLGGAGAAAAGGVLTLPGGDVVTPLTPEVTATGTGTRTVELGTAPRGSNSVTVALTCLTAGDFHAADGTGMVCDGPGDTVRWHLPITPGQHSTVIRAGDGQRWRLVARYANVTPSAWGVNAGGLTFGVANANGIPDLVAVVATNGRPGYVYGRDLNEPAPTTPQTPAPTPRSRTIPVYASDGRTVIGGFVIGAPDAPAQATRAPDTGGGTASPGPVHAPAPSPVAG